jgi:hypothetical protein
MRSPRSLAAPKTHAAAALGSLEGFDRHRYPIFIHLSGIKR